MPQRKLTALLLCLAMAVLLVPVTRANAASSDGSKGYTLNELGQLPLAIGGTPEFDILIPWVNPETGPEINPGIQKYLEMTGVKVNWQVVPADGWQEKRSIVIASGNMPDYIAATDNFGGARFSQTELLQYGSQGVFLDIIELMPGNSIYLQEILDRRPDVKQLVCTLDGKLYAPPDWQEGCFHCFYSQRAWINTAWLDRLGLDMPQTTEEYRQVLSAFKEQDANGNSDPNDEIPLTSTVDGWRTQIHGFLMNPFIYTDGEDQLNMDPETHTIYYAPTREEYREGLRYINSLYAEGLLDPAAFTQDARTMAQLNESGDATVIGGSFAGAEVSTLFYTVSQRFKEYDALPPLEGPSGLRQTPYFEVGTYQGVGAITKNAKDPDLLMRWIDFMYSEQITALGDLGIEGVHWRPGVEGELDDNGSIATYVRIPYDVHGVVDYSWQGRLPSYRDAAYNAKIFKTVNTDWHVPPEGDQGLQLLIAAKEYEPYAVDKAQIVPALAIEPEKATEYALLKTGVNDYTKESIARFIVGDLSLDKDWDSFQQMLIQLGLDEYLAITQDAYNARYK
ncbi:ABC transporter substrate-binding protein [Clostridia bacterium]|nr:ABC transporter substrate-binding protein [Clostridia bacterium]